MRLASIFRGWKQAAARRGAFSTDSRCNPSRPGSRSTRFRLLDPRGL